MNCCAKDECGSDDFNLLMRLGEIEQSPCPHTKVVRLHPNENPPRFIACSRRRCGLPQPYLGEGTCTKTSSDTIVVAALRVAGSNRDFRLWRAYVKLVPGDCVRFETSTGSLDLSVGQANAQVPNSRPFRFSIAPNPSMYESIAVNVEIQAIRAGRPPMRIYAGYDSIDLYLREPEAVSPRTSS